MRERWCVVWLLTSALVGCATTRVVRLEPEQGTAVRHVPRGGGAAVAVPETELQRTVASFASRVHPSATPMDDARRLFGVTERSGWYHYDGRSQRLLPDEDEGTRGLSLLESSQDDELTRGYLGLCERRGQSGDCLRLLREGPLLGSEGKYAVAMSIAMGAVWAETAEALKGLVAPEALMTMVTATATVYLLLWTFPEPTSKAIAAVLTALMIAYLGVDTVWTLLDGWRVLVKDVDRAPTFEGLRFAGERYGAVLGRNAARIFVLLATAAIGQTAASLATRAPTLPGAPQAAFALEAQAGIRLAALSGVQSVTMTAEGFTLGLAAGAALAQAGTNPRGEFSVFDWKGYPDGLAKPEGPFRLLEGAEYDAARAAANKANAALRTADPAKYAGKQIHEIHPVKFGGSPTDPANKVALTPAEHAQYTTFWNRMARDIQ